MSSEIKLNMGLCTGHWFSRGNATDDGRHVKYVSFLADELDDNFLQGINNADFAGVTACRVGDDRMKITITEESDQYENALRFFKESN